MRLLLPVLSFAALVGCRGADASRGSGGEPVATVRETFTGFRHHPALREGGAENRRLSDGAGRWIVPSVCPGKGCSWGEWIFDVAVTLRPAPVPTADSIGAVPVGEPACVETGVLVIEQEGLAVALRAVSNTEESGDSVVIAAGDTLAVLDSDGNAWFAVKWRDRILFMDLSIAAGADTTNDGAFRVLRQPSDELWLRLHDPSTGIRGWTARGDAKRTNGTEQPPCSPPAPAPADSGAIASIAPLPATIAETYPQFRIDSAMIASEYGDQIPRTDGAGRWLVSGYCPGERCGFGARRFEEFVTLRRAPSEKSDSIASIPPQRLLCERNAMLLVHAPQIYIVRKAGALADTLPAEVGDTVLVLNYVGESYSWAFWRGRLIVTQLDSRNTPMRDTTLTGMFRIVSPARDEQWTLLEDPYTKQRGWIGAETVRGSFDESTTACGTP